MTTDRLGRFFAAWNDHDVDASYFTSDGAYLASIGPEGEGTAFRALARCDRRLGRVGPSGPTAAYLQRGD